MAIEITVPRLGWNMEEGVFVGWLKRDGDAVKPGEPLFTLEGDKAAQEVEATDGGILRIAADGPQDGETMPVGAVLGYLLAPGEAPPTTSPPAVPSASPMRTPEPPAGPAARRLARQLNVDLERVHADAPRQRISEQDVRAHASPRRSSRRRRVGRRLDETGRQWAHRPHPRGRRPRRREGAGACGLDATCHRRTDDAQPAFDRAGDADDQRRRDQPRQPPRSVQGRRRRTVRATTTSSSNSPPPLCSNIRCSTPAGTASASNTSAAVHIGIAVDTDAGLVVPVIRDVPTLSPAAGRGAIAN